MAIECQRRMQSNSDRYFGYVVPKADGTHDFLVHPRPAGPEVIAEFERLTGPVMRLQPLVIALDACEADFESLAQWPSDEEERLRNSGGFNIPISLGADLMVESVRRVNSYLASASSLIGQATVYVSKHFGSDSEFGKAWNELRKELHAGSLGFRIAYELRNYGQHFALPLNEVSITGHRESNGEVSMICGTKMDRDALLSSGYKWKKRAEDLAQLPAEFDLLPLTEDYQRCLRTLIIEIVRADGNHLRDCVEYLRVIRRVLKAPPNARIWLFNGRGEHGVPPNSGLIVPEEQVAWITRKLATAANALS